MASGTAIYCPSCQSRNIHNKLKLYQINLTTAVYLCEDKNCSYPEGYEWIEVNRSLDELLFKKKQSTGDSDLDNWLDEAFERETSNANNVVCKKVTTEHNNDDFLAEIFKGLDSGGSDTINNKGKCVSMPYVRNESSIASQTDIKTQENVDKSLSSCDYLDSVLVRENGNFQYNNSR